MTNSIKSAAPDYAIAALRASLGAVPVLGPLFVELATITIPNQRLERITLFLERLNRHVHDLGEDIAELDLKLQSEPERIGLLEEGATIAARASSQQTIDRIALVAATGLYSPDRDAERERDLLRLVENLGEEGAALLLGIYSPHRWVEWSILCDEVLPTYGKPPDDPVLSERENERRSAEWSVEWHHRRQNRQVVEAKLASLGLIARASVNKLVHNDPDQIAYPPEYHSFEVTGAGREILWRLGLINDGMRYITELEPKRKSGGWALSDDRLLAMFEYAVEHLGKTYQRRRA